MLTETERKLVRAVYARMQQGDSLALVSALFLPEEEKGYLMYLCEKETHDEAQPVIPKRTVVQEPLRTCQWCVSRQCETCAERKPKACP